MKFHSAILVFCLLLLSTAPPFQISDSLLIGLWLCLYFVSVELREEGESMENLNSFHFNVLFPLVLVNIGDFQEEFKNKNDKSCTSILSFIVHTMSFMEIL